ncbi:hypothetical protein MAR_029362 [Mya arenaria]|uniref:Secreted protein n=1 Tax=Mya arenaria TaxID=6604 RepID=A0ABY7DG74_MYAAR|nr:hypothetical protein MAR_029362 [Mya arenaria]
MVLQYVKGLILQYVKGLILQYVKGLILQCVKGLVLQYVKGATVRNDCGASEQLGSVTTHIHHCVGYVLTRTHTLDGNVVHKLLPESFTSWKKNIELDH